jgi:thioredoxin reductase (NADPH)
MKVDVVVVGAGPVGLACALEVQRKGLSCLTLDKGSLVNSLVGYPTNMEFFSTPELLEIGGYPLVTSNYKPRREEVIDYYRRVASKEGLDIGLYERVTGLDGDAGAFTVRTSHRTVSCAVVIVATGFFDQPNTLSIPGADLPKVSHYFKEPFAYARRKVAIIGAKNSAAKAALQCHRYGAHVTMVVRGPEIAPTVKYWIRPDLINRIAEGSIEAHFGSNVTTITDQAITVTTPSGILELENHVVLALTGYHPDYSFLKDMGVSIQDDAVETPSYDPNTFESNRAGLYLAGTICGGRHTSRWFIENGRYHAEVIAEQISGRYR